MSDSHVITDEEYAMISSLAAKQVKLETELKQLEEELKEKGKELNDVRDRDLPNAMAEVGLEEVKLKSGHKISIKSEIYASISAERTDKAYAWLRGNDFGSLIKNQIIAEFGKGEDERATEAAMLLAEHGFAPTHKESVHPMTLKAFLKEQIEKGLIEVPLDLFGAYTFNRSKVTKT